MRPLVYTVVVSLAFWSAVRAVAANGPDEEADRGAAAQQTVQELIEQMASDDFSGLRSCRKLAEIGEPAMPDLIRATQHAVPRVRYWSVAALSSIGNQEAVPAIRKLLEDPSDFVRAVAVWHLGRWFDRADVRDSVVKTLQDENSFVRGWALRLIQTKKYRDAIPEVRALLQADEPELRYDALHALAVLQGPDALQTLKKALRDDASPLVRECAVRCCTVMEPRTPQTADLLISALRDKDENIRSVAAELLSKGFGQYFGFDPSAKPLEREGAARQWRNWYEAHKKKLRWSEEHHRFEVAEEAAARE